MKIKLKLFCFLIPVYLIKAVSFSQNHNWSYCDLKQGQYNNGIQQSDQEIVEKTPQAQNVLITGFRDIKVAVECSHSLYLTLGSDKEVVRWYIYNLVNQVSDVYMKEFGAHVQVSYIEIDTVQESYPGPGDFVTKWETYKQNIDRDFTHYITSSSGGSVGLTTTSCSRSSNYALSYDYAKVNMMDFGNIPPQVFSHEMGHNLGGIHPQDAIGGNASCQLAGGIVGDIMTYCNKRDLKYWYKTNVLKTKIACYTVITTAPAAPALNVVSQASATPYLFWKPAYGATGYDIQIAADAAFSNIVFQKQSPVPVVHAYGLSNQTYYWRVKATNGAGASAWSAVSSFAASASVKWPAAIYPENLSKNVPDNNLHIDWSPVPGATQYEVQVAYVKYSNTFSTTLVSQTVSGTTLSLASLTQAANWNVSRHNIFSWRVRVAGGNWSPVYSFKPLPAAPVLVFPAANQNQVAPQGIALKWKSDFRETVLQSYANMGVQYDGRVYQQVQVATDPGFNTIVVDYIDSSLISGLRDASGNALTKTKTVNLQTATQYYWRVKAGINKELSGWPTEMADWTSSSFSTTGFVAVQEVNREHEGFVVYPNPSDGNFNISCEQPGTIRLYDALGKVIYDNIKIDKTAAFHFHSLPNGLYLVQFMNAEKGVYTKRLVVDNE